MRRLADLPSPELEQPLVFFRSQWELRWLSVQRVLGRIGAIEAEAGRRSISDAWSSRPEPAELESFLEACSAWLAVEDEQSEAGGVDGSVELLERAAAPAALALDALGGASGPGERRHSLVLAGGWQRLDSWIGLRLAVDSGAAMILPPEEGAWSWTVRTVRPSLVVASADQLAVLAADLRSLGGLRRRRVVAPLRSVFAVGGPGEEAKGAELLSKIAHLVRPGVHLQWLSTDGPAPAAGDAKPAGGATT